MAKGKKENEVISSATLKKFKPRNKKEKEELKRLEQKEGNVDSQPMKDQPPTDDSHEKLTAMQEKFCQLIVADPKRRRANAAKKAGYSEKCAHVQANENLKKPKIIRRIQELEAEYEEMATMKKKDIIDRYERFANVNVLDYFEWDEIQGVRAKPSYMLTRFQASRIIGIKEVYDKKGKRKIQITLQDPEKALNALSRIEGLFKDALVHQGEIKTTGVLVVPASMTKEQWLEFVKNNQAQKPEALPTQQG